MQRYVKNVIRYYGICCSIHRNNCLKLYSSKECGKLRTQLWNRYGAFTKLTRNVAYYSTDSNNSTRTVTNLQKYVSEDKRIYLNFIKGILEDTKDFEKLTESELILLIEQCGENIPHESCRSRHEVCQKIFEKLKDTNMLSSNMLHAYIRTCTQNRITLNYNELLSFYKHEPTRETYKLLLWNVCEKGDVNQAFDILSDMKNKKISIDEEVFNALVLGHTIFGGAKDGEIVFQTMKAAQIPDTAETRFCLIKGVAARNDVEEFKTVIEKYPLTLGQDQMLKLFETLRFHRNTDCLDQVFHLINKDNMSREFLRKLEKLCIHLTHMKNPTAAVKIYTTLIKPTITNHYGVILFREMLHCNIQIEQIISLIKEFVEKELIDRVLLSLTEVALRSNYCMSSWVLFEHLPFLRPHFFWPLLLDSKYRDGEEGIMETLTKMIQFKVPVDEETLEIYCLPYCDLINLEIIVDKLKKLGITVKAIVNSLVTVLINIGEIQTAFTLFNQYNIQLDNERVLRVLPYAWKNNSDPGLVVFFLQKLCESGEFKHDLVGEFLLRSAKLYSSSEEFGKYLELLKIISSKKLRVNLDSADILYNMLSHRCTESDLFENLAKVIESMSDYTIKIENQPIPHPKNMNIEQLEGHLIELKSKSMETRGVLRKLIQYHASKNNFDRVMELREEFKSSGYEESAGMKSSVMHSFTQAGNLDAALTLYKEIKSIHSTFKLDAFKVVDLAYVMVKEKRLDEAKDLVDKESKSQLFKGDVSAIERNCLRLLGIYNDDNHQAEMFNLLLEQGFCKPTNLILGPLVRIHLNRNDPPKAGLTFVRYAEKYKRTPMKLEVMCALLDKKYEDLLQQVLYAVEKVHGKEAANESLFMALTEKKLAKPLQNFLMTKAVISNKRLEKLYEKWVVEDKIDCFHTILNVNDKVRSKIIDVAKLHSCVMKIYGKRNDCEGAISFYEQLLENETIVDKQTEEELNKLLIKCNYHIPDSLKNKIG